MNLSVPVAYAGLPVGGCVWRDVRPQGQTLAEIVASVPDLPHWFEDYGAVCVDGVPVPRRYWSRRQGECTRRLVPKARAPLPAWVTLHVIPQGGGGDTKKIVSIVASVALLAVGALITGGAAALLAPGLFAAGSTSASLLAAGVTTLGRLALTLLSPPAAREKTSNPSAPTLGSAGANGNALQPGGPIPRVCGRLKVFPSFACLPLIELNGDDETAEAAYLLGGPHQIEDIRIEGAQIEDVPGVQYYVNEGLVRSVTSILGRYGYQRSPNFELQGHRRDNDGPKYLRNPSSPESDLPDWRVETTAQDPDEIWLQITWPTGMTDSDNNRKVAMPVRIRMREVGTTAWTNLPEMMFRHNRTGAISKKIVLKWGAPPSPLADQPELFGAWHSFHTVPPQTVDPVGAGGWTAHASFQGNPAIYNDTLRVVRAYDGFTVYLDDTVFLRGKRWELGIIRGCLVDAPPFYPDEYRPNALSIHHLSYFDYWKDGALFQVPSHDIYSYSILDRVVLSRVASVKNQNPLPVAGDASIEIRARNVQLAQVSCIASAYVPDWNGSEWTGSVTSLNPGTHLAHMMTGALTEDPVGPNAIANGELVAFRQRCIDEGYEVAMSVDGQNWWEAMQAVASCGFGRVRAGTRFGVAQDRDSSAEAGQHFSVRNASRFSLEKAFTPLEDAFRVSYRDRALGWEQAERLVIRPGLSAGDVTRITSVNAVGLDTEAAVVRRFGQDLKSQELRDWTLSFDVPPEGLVSQMGDVVSVTHQMLSRHHHAARVSAIETNGAGLCTGLVLDNRHGEGSDTDLALAADIAALLDLAAQGVILAATIIASDLSEMTHEIAQGGVETNRITFATPFDPTGIIRQNMVVIGPAENITERLVIMSVRPARRGQRSFCMRITAIPEAPELWT